MQRLLQDLSLTAVVAGAVAVLVGFTSSVAVVYAAAQALGATPQQTTSWIWALGIGMGVTSLAMSLYYRAPVLTAWSTPSAALLAATQGLGMAEAVGVFVAAAAAVALAGYSGLFERIMNRIPAAIAAALLAGVLTRFALDAALAARSAPLLVVAMLAVYLLGRRWWPRYAVPVVMLVGIAVAAAQGRIATQALSVHWAVPVWTTPTFAWGSLIGVALPLFVVTMASQNLPGVAAQRAAGYTTPVSPVVGATGLATLVLAPFGAFSLALAAITASICLGREAHEDPARRYVAAAAAGVFYIALGLVGGAVATLLAALPPELVVAAAGLALVGTIAGALSSALAEPAHRDAAALTFIVTLSGISVAGIGAPFWGVVVGAAALFVQQWRAAR